MKPNILLVDDDLSKIEMIRVELHREGIDDTHIAIATDASQARRALNVKAYDIMLLDILLPARAGATPQANISIDFIKQIVEDGTTPAPTHILGMSAEPSVVENNQEEFLKLTSQIWHIAPGEDEWKQSLKILLDRFSLNIASRKTYDFDICFQTALWEPELESIVKGLPIKWENEVMLDTVLCRIGTFDLEGKILRIVGAHACQMGMVAATHLSDLLIREFKPRVIAMSGICGGIGTEVRIGDVIVAEKSWDWQAGKWDSMGKLRSAPDQKSASLGLVGLARAREGELSKLYKEFSGKKPEHTPSLHIGPMVSGSAVIADIAMHELFKEQHRKSIAIDMECYGLYYSVAMASEPVPKVICIKAISDLADSNKSDDFREYCSNLSAQILFSTLVRYFS